MINVNDRVVVRGRMETPVYVKEIIDDPESARTILILTWGKFGESKVYLHDEGKEWYKYSSCN
jgi:hypothetical protein